MGEEVSALTAGPGGLCLEGTQDVSAARQPPLQVSRMGFPSKPCRKIHTLKRGNKTEPP